MKVKPAPSPYEKPSYKLIQLVGKLLIFDPFVLCSNLSLKPWKSVPSAFLTTDTSQFPNISGLVEPLFKAPLIAVARVSTVNSVGSVIPKSTKCRAELTSSREIASDSLTPK